METESLAAIRAYVEGRPLYAVCKPVALADLGELTWLTLAADMQLATACTLPISSGKHNGGRSSGCSGPLLRNDVGTLLSPPGFS